MISIQGPKYFRSKTNRVSTNSYSLLTFLPARLFRECTKSFNIFFLIMCCIVLVPGLTKFSKSAYILCVLMIISVNILKAAVHEIKKYTLDQKINTQKITVIRFGNISEINREDINPGEKIVIPKDKSIPVDILLLGAYKTQMHAQASIGEIYIETSALDGETSLKNRKSLMPLGETGEVSYTDISCLEDTHVQYDKERQEGSIRLDLLRYQNFPKYQKYQSEDSTVHIPFSKENVVPRSSTVYTNCTVVGLSLGGEERPCEPVRVKGSLFMNMLSLLSIYTIIVYLFLLLLSSAGSCWFMVNSEWLLGPLDYSVFGGGVRCLFSNVIIFSSLIPLSLFVTLDGLRVAYSIFVQFDPEMTQDSLAPTCNVHGVLEDIGMVTHILSDKTGTLTLNKMNFEGIYLPGDQSPIMFYSTGDNQSTTSDSSLVRMADREDSLFSILTILLCHSVDVVDGSYIGVSQEEVCMLEYFKLFSYEVITRKSTSVIISAGSVLIPCVVLSVLPFNPSIARMSIVVMIKGRVFILTKGSDEVVNSTGSLRVSGEYRALIMSGKEITENDLLIYANNHPTDKGAVDNVVQIMKKEKEKYSTDCTTVLFSELVSNSVYNSIDEIRESVDQSFLFDLPVSFILYFEAVSSYTGTLYIKDTLQPQVESSISSITDKGIRIWMVTGDRRESAISCGISAGMDYNRYKVFSGTELVQVLEGTSPSAIMEQSSVIVYRCSPGDKKSIARHLRLSGYIVLSIGDGNNDIGMIEEADIGIGIYSSESNLAALSADLVIPSFYGLSRLILVHGPVSLSRLRNVFMFFIFKSTCLAVCQCVYGMCVGASGSIAPSSLFLLFFNSLITTPLSVEMGLFRRICLVDSIFVCFLSGICYGIGSFLVVYSSSGAVDVFGSDGKIGGHAVVSCLFSLCLFISTIMYFIYSSDSFVSYSFFGLFVSVSFFVLSVGIEAGFKIFSSPFFYVCAAYMIVVGMIIERGFCLIKKKKHSRIPEELQYE